MVQGSGLTPPLPLPHGDTPPPPLWCGVVCVPPTPPVVWCGEVTWAGALML